MAVLPTITAAQDERQPTDRSFVDLNQRHLQAELALLDVRLRRAVRRWQLAGQDATDAFRGLKISDTEASDLLDRPLAANWGTIATLDPEETAAFTTAESTARHAVQQTIAAAQQTGINLRLEQLAATFRLDQFEIDTLLIGLAPAFDLRYERLYAYLQDDVTHKRPSLNLALDLLTEPGLNRLRWLARFADNAPLLRHHLIEWLADPAIESSPLSQTFAVDRAIVAWLLDQYQPQAELGAHAELIAPAANPIDDLLAAPVQSALTRAVAAQSIVVMRGVDQSSQLAAARVLACQLQRTLLVVDLAAIITETVTPLRAVRLALRDARLTNALPCLLGWDATLSDGAPAPDALSEVCAFDGAVIIAGQRAWQPRGIDRARALVWLEFPIPDYAQRSSLWLHFIDEHSSTPLRPSTPLRSAQDAVELRDALPSTPLRSAQDAVELRDAGQSKDALSDLDLTLLAGQFLLTATQIRDAVASARDAAAQRNEPLAPADLFAAARAHSSPALGSLARKIEPRYTWSDIVLPDDQMAMLREIIATVRGRPIVLETWGVGQKLASSSGVTVLFSGPPGTGKTMAAEVVAAELSLDLYKIDLSTVVNKYIGETEKNLGRIFDEASNSNAILFFDESDAIFGKRSEVKDAHDRYANIEISYLLQRMEDYDGVTVLATNLRANMDDAFKRRLQFAVDFPFPDEAYRLRIWQALFPISVPRADDLDLTLLARRFKLAGGNIRNIIISAAYLAATNGGKISMDHLLHGARRELQKMGRLINEKDLANG